MRFVPDKVTRSVGRASLIAQKNSPHILFGVGVAGIITSTILACRATLKLEKNLDEIKTDLESVKMLGEDSRKADTPYHEREYYRDLGYVYGKSTVKFVKLYGPSIAIGAVSITALATSHVQMTRRNAALTATLAAVTKAYEDYRNRVRDAIGPSKEMDIYRNIQDKEIEDDGRKKLVKVPGQNGGSIYAREFREGNKNFLNSDEYNRIFIECQQQYANDQLRSRGHIFLNEVYDSLGLERSQPGAVVGWLKNNDDGDNYIDFGLNDGINQTHLLSIGQTFYLDFNVDGSIWDKI
jgi:Family of unknown function (DUF6353)